MSQSRSSSFDLMTSPTTCIFLFTTPPFSLQFFDFFEIAFATRLAYSKANFSTMNVEGNSLDTSPLVAIEAGSKPLAAIQLFIFISLDDSLIYLLHRIAD